MAAAEVTVRPARVTDIRSIALRMREIDVLECRAFGHAPRQALRLGYLGSTLCWTGCVDGRPELMMGAVPGAGMGAAASPWMLGTEEAFRHPRPLLALTGPVLAAMDARYRRLENYAHQTNTKTHRWLRRLGFTVEHDVTVFGGEPFVRFWREG